MGQARQEAELRPEEENAPTTLEVVADIASSFTYASFQNAIPVLIHCRLQRPIDNFSPANVN